MKSRTLLVGALVATVTFVLIHLAPGDPASIIAGPDATPENIARLRRHLGLDEPLPAQLLHWYGRLLRGGYGPAKPGNGRPASRHSGTAHRLSPTSARTPGASSFTYARNS